MSRKHKEAGLAVVSLSFDDPNNQDAVLRFLRKQGAEFDNLIARPAEGADASVQFGTPNGIPLYQLYDRLGLLRYQFSPIPTGLENGELPDNIDQRVKELLAE